MKIIVDEKAPEGYAAIMPTMRRNETQEEYTDRCVLIKNLMADGTKPDASE